jgi:predicted NBD/HSP70 family sugar kinase
VSRLAERAGFEFAADLPAAERLVRVQEAMAAGDRRAAEVYDSLGICFGYAVAQYAEDYSLEHLLVLGRVTSGSGGDLMLERAREVLRREAPAVAERIQIHQPDEKDKRHGQAVAAASLPALRQPLRS